jgi:hypothetical protein
MFPKKNPVDMASRVAARVAQLVQTPRVWVHFVYPVT